MGARAGVARRVAPWRAVLAAAWLALLAPATAFADVAIPTLAQHVTDQTGTLAAADIARLEQRLVALEQRKGSQVAILVVATTQPETIEGYALRVAEKKQLGREQADDGLLLLIAKDDRKARLEVGRGLEGAIPDAIASRIIREYLAPKFRQDDYAGGLGDALDVIEKLIDGEPLPPPMADERASGDDGGLVPALMIGFFVGVFAASTRLKPKVLRMAGAGGVAAVAVLVLLGAGFGLVVAAVVAAIVSMVAGSGGRYIGHGGGGGGFGGGGWGGGSSGGGGWSGGGGSFGGGGASGGW